MELWIRSQDRAKLKIIHEIVLSVSGGNIFCDKEIFGEYKTKYRALEVLNEIQKLLNTFDPANMAKMIVYEMPEE